MPKIAKADDWRLPKGSTIRKSVACRCHWSGVLRDPHGARSMLGRSMSSTTFRSRIVVWMERKRCRHPQRQRCARSAIHDGRHVLHSSTRALSASVDHVIPAANPGGAPAAYHLRGSPAPRPPPALPSHQSPHPRPKKPRLATGPRHRPAFLDAREVRAPQALQRHRHHRHRRASRGPS